MPFVGDALSSTEEDVLLLFLAGTHRESGSWRDAGYVTRNGRQFYRCHQALGKKGSVCWVICCCSEKLILVPFGISVIISLARYYHSFSRRNPNLELLRKIIDQCGLQIQFLFVLYRGFTESYLRDLCRI